MLADGLKGVNRRRKTVRARIVSDPVPIVVKAPKENVQNAVVGYSRKLLLMYHRPWQPSNWLGFRLIVIV